MNEITTDVTMPSDLQLNLVNEAATAELAQRLAQQVRAGDVIFLQGELGAGKTTFTRHFARALGIEGRIKSPTYTLVESYTLNAGTHDATTLHHFDLYRLGDPREWYSAGFDEYLNDRTIALIEWPSQAAGALPAPTFSLTFEHADDLTDVDVESFDGVRRVRVAGTVNRLSSLG
ncbi:tRNA threonylcarbamoyladenosine biosynthesis protein TsaE [Ephemeroptericola cinctiostellae]|uniref:tRNA threonylcarbamoyladenosine biosynthesis protein TsaE n=1 Tax=Ephemeroptericola cinctiostellae TaxID=2268024 RepID=A0A345D936_9BURK|nr:tRNA (adenosine(37)-N6)-threonylcarbamoyltransferase complex ATPase subunit type 1 TsaE [Ephemeroptericola cinctiostellae]AXF84874.1 tRNA threonylcarbamoyladenosine biosynthesis protein TsaE [Ephemeroptericola cinctiostellae]